MRRARWREENAERVFSAAELKDKSVSGFAISMTAQLFRLALQFVYQVLIARFLVPDDFGLVAMAAPVLLFSGLFTDFGFSQATVQREKITQLDLSFAFWASLLLTTAIAALTAVSATFVAAFYDERRVAPIIVALSGLMLLAPLCSQHMALLNRRLAYKSLVVVDLISFAAGAASGLVAAANGWQYWSIIINQGATLLAMAVLSWVLSGWVPTKPEWTGETKEILKFGGNLTSFSFFNFFARNLDNVLIGRFVGETALGLYDRAYKLLLLPLSQITGPIAKIAVPLLSRSRSDPRLYAKSYFTLLEAILMATYPGVLFAIITSDQLIAAALGPKWAEISPIFSVLGFGALFAPISNSTGWLFVTQNRTAEMRNTGALSSLAFIASFCAGLPWGALGVALSYIAVGTVQGPLVWRSATRVGPVTFPMLISKLTPYLIAASATSIALLVTQRNIPIGLISLAMLLLEAQIMFLGLLFLFGESRETIFEFLVQARRLLGKMSSKVFNMGLR